MLVIFDLIGELSNPYLFFKVCNCVIVELAPMFICGIVETPSPTAVAVFMVLAKVSNIDIKSFIKVKIIF